MAPRRYEEAPPRKTLFFFAEQPLHFGYYLLGLGHAPLARKAAGKLAFARLDDGDARRAQRGEVMLRGGVGIHVQIHRRSYGDGAACRQIGRQQQIVCHARGHFGQRVGRGGRYKIAVRPLAERDMRVPCTVFGVEKVDQNRVARQRGHGKRRDELFGHGCHDHAHLASGALQKTAKHSRLVCRYAARDSEYDMFSLQHDLVGYLVAAVAAAP